MKIIILSKPEEVTNHIGNLGGIIALAKLKHFGRYRCDIDGKKHLFIIK